MQAQQKVLANQRLRQEPSWGLLALDHAPLALGLLQAYLLEKDRRLPHSVLLGRLRQDLEQLRLQGQELAQTAEAYLAAWLRAGYLVRNFGSGAAEEEYELSAAAVRAVQFLESLSERRAFATESRLSLVIEQLARLAEQTETDPAARLARLEHERERLDQEIAAVRAGRLDSLPDDRALERVREIAALARELGADFRRVRDDFQALNRDLRERIVEDEGSRGEVLAQVFSGVDLVAESEAGRTFRAFWRLLTDAEQSLAFESALQQVLERDFTHGLDRRERRFLLGLTRALLDNGGEVHEVFQHFARGLREFVQSRAYREQRRLARLLKIAQRAALKLKDVVRPIDAVGLDLHLSSATIHSLGQWQLHDPELEAAAGGMRRAPEAEITLDSVSELLAHSEIDFRRLRAQVAALLARRAQVSVAEVLEAYPATQGLGSVVGLLALGAREGIVTGKRDRVHWTGLDGERRAARIPRIHFVREERRAGVQ